ncbi:virulence factor Mce family protein [Mycolicibacterium chubuense NBB4]|uniref:Virulence factor Mce family protein n=1 Tax=Mycolicibacterium chubuense (strain NBB4) TaxID=710421 RepID=I4BHF6_MYCCN|nr:MCE family protein [Mycolicibacterium chubuense]AFM16713.1 virulence factor Mce family protein [Mycolicibacterium chubuense NBB4]
MSKRQALRPLLGLAALAVVAGLVLLTATLFRGGFTTSIPVTVLSPRAGLVMNPDAKVTLHGVQVGAVTSIDDLPDGQAAIRLAIEPGRLSIIPSNVSVDISSTTVFGAKQIRLVLPDNPSPEPIRPGQTLGADHVMIEVNTIFQQLVTVLSTIQPEKLNETLGAIAAALHGRGQQLGDTLTRLNSFLSQVNPHLGALSHDLAAAPTVLAAYADAAPNLLSVAESATDISKTVVEKADDLDALLVSATGLGDIGNRVLTRNGTPLAQVLHLLVPTTSLTDQYREALNCGLGALRVMASNPPLNEPGVEVLAGFFWGQDRYRYPNDLPKVAAKGGPQCTDLPKVPYGKAPPFVISDTGANPWKYANPGVVLNSDLLKQILFGPIAGPPRNSAQIGQPG